MPPEFRCGRAAMAHRTAFFAKRSQFAVSCNVLELKSKSPFGALRNAPKRTQFAPARMLQGSHKMTQALDKQGESRKRLLMRKINPT